MLPSVSMKHVRRPRERHPANPCWLAVEVFSGCGRLSKALRSKGWAVIEWDICNGKQYDFRMPDNIRRLRRICATAHLVHIATPCSSFSGARRGKIGAPGGPLRSKATPMGVEGLSAIDAGKVVLGNKMLAVTTSLVALCRAHGIPVTVENPRRSRLWWTPSMLQALSKGGRKLNMALLG